MFKRLKSLFKKKESPSVQAETPEKKAEATESATNHQAVSEDVQKLMDNFDLSDPNALELLLDDEESSSDDDSKASKRTQQIHEAQKTLLSVEIVKQKGVEVYDNQICVPGRVSLVPVTLLEILLCTIGFAAGFLHFAALSPNYLLALIVVSGMLLIQIVIYHSAYRAMRMFLTILQTLGTLLITAFVTWAFMDLMIYPKAGHTHFLLLAISTISFALIPLVMLSHLVYLGRGCRWIEIRKKGKTAAETPTKILKTPSNTPTKILKSS